MAKRLIRKVDTTPEKWIRVVLRKTLEAQRRGADFNYTRWIFSSDESLGIGVNGANILAEHNALRSIANFGATTLIEKDVKTDLNRFNTQNDYRLNESTFIKPNDDYVSNHYGWAVWLSSFDHDKFINLCKQYHVSTNVHNINAKLRFENISNPVVRAEKIDYELPTMAEDKKPFQIIEYCYERHGQVVSLQELKEQLKISGVDNIREALKHTHFGYSDGPLKPFIKVSAKTIKFVDKVKLSPGELELIANVSYFYDA